jgi:hypothetical protein
VFNYDLLISGVVRFVVCVCVCFAVSVILIELLKTMFWITLLLF